MRPSTEGQYSGNDCNTPFILGGVVDAGGINTGIVIALIVLAVFIIIVIILLVREGALLNISGDHVAPKRLFNSL